MKAHQLLPGGAVSLLVALTACNVAKSTSASGPQLLWSQHFVSLGSQLATDGYRVFVMGTQRSVNAFRTTTGDLLWSVSTAVGDTSSTQSTTSTGRLGCVTGFSLLVCADRDLVGMGYVDGTLRWRSQVTVSCNTNCQPVSLSDSSVYVFATNGTLIAANQRTGLPRWISKGPSAAMSVDSGLVALGASVAGSPATVTALNIGTGSTRWSTALPASALVLTGTAIWQNVVLASASDGKVYGLDRASGSVLWSVAGADTVTLASESIPCVSGTTPQPMLVLGNSLFVATSTGTMAMFDLPSHTLLHRVTNSLGPHLGVPLVTDSTAVYLIGLNGDVAAFSTTDAHLLQAYSVSPEKVCAMAQWQDRLFFVGETGVYAVSKALSP